MPTILKLSKKDLVNGLPKLKFDKDKECEAFFKGKKTRASFRAKKFVSTAKILELLHMDLFGLISTTSLRGKFFFFAIVDDYSRYTWTFFLAEKSETYENFF